MSDSPESAHFNYMNLLGKLEEACREHKPRLSSIRAGVKRLVDNPLHFARLAGAKAPFAVRHVLARVAGKASQFKNLGIEAERLAETEAVLLRNIHNYTSDRTRADRSLADIWPSPIPDGRVLERLIATTLGLASVRQEADGDDAFRVALSTAVRTVLLPALAWRILCELHTYHEVTREELRRRLCAKLEAFVGVQRDFASVNVESRDYRLGSLTLHRAWVDVLGGPVCRLTQDDIASLMGRELGVHLRQPDSTQARANLFPLLTEAFGWGLRGSERAHAIELAARRRPRSAQSKGKAVFASSRLRLLDAAHSEPVRHFAELTRLNLAEANRRAGEARKQSSEVELYAGMAYWLANACFRRPMAYVFRDEGQGYPIATLAREGEMVDIVGGAPTENTHDYNTASEEAALLLERALELGVATEDQNQLMRRFLAGFATNPRYWRGPFVLGNADRWVDDYAQAGGRRSLVHQLQARLAWHKAARAGKRERAPFVDEALEQYGRCFDAAGADLHDLDPEAPLHLFPEIAVLVGDEGPKRLYNMLETVDFILSRNFSIYMDIDAERASIAAGLRQAAATPLPVRTRSAANQPTR